MFVFVAVKIIRFIRSRYSKTYVAQSIKHTKNLLSLEKKIIEDLQGCLLEGIWMKATKIKKEI